MKKSQKLLKLIIALLVIIVIIAIVILIQQPENNNNIENNNIVNETENNNQQEIIKLGQSFSTNIGTYIIDKEGYVYFIPNSSVSNSKELEEFGTYGYYNTKEVYVPNPMPENEEELGCFYGYKLDLTNIKSGYNFNTEEKEYVLFTDNNGKLNEISYKMVEIEENSFEIQLVDIKLTKNVSNYNNIVNIVKTTDEDGEYVKLINKSGNQYAYYGAENSEKNVSEQLSQCFTAKPFGIDMNINVVLSSNGDVYCNVDSEYYEIDLSSCGVAGNYNNILPNTKDENNFEGYKLNISNITAVYGYEFGNSGLNYSLLLLDKDGNITELVILHGTDGIEVKFEKVTEYSNIVTIVDKLYTGSHGAIVIDKDGNEYYYNSIVN